MKEDIGDIRERGKDYLKYKTLTYIKEVIKGRENFYNGFVVSVHTDLIVFFDIIIKREFPIQLDAIEVLEPSKKDFDIKTALEIYKENKK